MSERVREESRKEFQEYFMLSSLPSVRLGLFITLILFSFFALFNITFFADLPEQLFHTRFWIISPIMVAIIAVTYIKPLHKWLHPIYFILNMLICGAVFYVGLNADYSHIGFDYYFAWVMLVVIGLFVFFKMPFRSVVIIGLLQTLAFASANIINGTLEHRPFFFFNTIFFVIATYSIGFMMAFMFKSINYKNFSHQKALAKNNLQLLEEIKERKQAEEALQRSEILYHDTIDAIPDWIYVIDQEMRFVMLNSSLQEEHLRQGFPVNCIGKKITKVYPFIPDSTIEEIKHVFRSGETLVGEQQFFLRDKTIYGETRKVPIFKTGEVFQVLTIMRNRSKEREIEELKQKNIQQKEVMLREIHHRVKNNLAIVVSLLNLQLRNSTDHELIRIIRDIEMRIRSMALIHEHLYRSENLDQIPLAAYLFSLATIIQSTFSGHRVNLVTSLEATEVSIEIALPIGLIANELLTNAFKYAFPQHHEGEIKIHLQKETEDILTLIISDNGVGLPDSFSMDSEKSLGMFIVKLLVEQLEGTIEISHQNGTSFTIHFRNLSSKKKEIPLN